MSLTKRVGLIAVIAVLGLFVAAGPAGAHGVSPAKLGNAGWTCFNVPDLGVHCVPPASDFPPSIDAPPASVTVRVFDTDNPTATDADFLGTELLIREDLFHGQPCPQDGGVYHELFLGPLTYYACHHYDTSH